MDLLKFTNEARYSQIDSEFPDPSKFPLYYSAHKTVVELNEGEMLFIPAGMYHLVVSCNDGFNFAVNYWYTAIPTLEHKHQISKHNIPDVDLPEIFKDRGKMEVYKSQNSLFPSLTVEHRYPNWITKDFMTFDEFMQTKNKRLYIVQGQHDYFYTFAPTHPSELMTFSFWANFGGQTTTTLHCDGWDNWLCQVKGKKRIILFPHQDRDLLYMWNPTPERILLEIAHNKQKQLDYFVLHYPKLVSDEVCQEILVEKNDFIKSDNLKNLLSLMLFKYDEKFNSNFCSGQLPWRFRRVHTNNIDYFNLGSYSRQYLYPYIFVACIKGYGYININGERTKFQKRDGFVIPHSFLYRVAVQGDVTIITI